ncbi:DUF3793 family protein [Marinisporobacter balticus]|uniref:Uncharacterized protein DUF3793 n=1 Tax=Marinisporobacter balticus TaxID=2018667 RepID=A0A4R2KVW3_9FIRM|nr:DUF3793 family protein [Marinisporobacter balticus]TCO78651.1 uncharacterized protein DUF3793 [Marinisporobacter balticus]
MNENKHICFKQSTDDFIKWLVQLLGPVLLGAKPAEILSFQNHDKALYEKMNKIQDSFKNCKKISYKIFHFNHRSTKVFFYNTVSLDTVLSDYQNAKFLSSMGYPKNYSLDHYIDHMIHKMMHGTIPDEIGIFLGYPLKDVLGFMGHPSLKLTKINGWRVYGDATLSDKKYNEFINAKNKIKHLLTYFSIDNVLTYA